MTGFDVRGKIRQVGNSFALLIPAAEGRRAKLRLGQGVKAHIEPDDDSPLGLLKGVIPYEEYQRSKEGVWRDRI